MTKIISGMHQSTAMVTLGLLASKQLTFTSWAIPDGADFTAEHLLTTLGTVQVTKVSEDEYTLRVNDGMVFCKTERSASGIVLTCSGDSEILEATSRKMSQI